MSPVASEFKDLYWNVYTKRILPTNSEVKALQMILFDFHGRIEFFKLQLQASVFIMFMTMTNGSLVWLTRVLRI